MILILAEFERLLLDPSLGRVRAQREEVENGRAQSQSRIMIEIRTPRLCLRRATLADVDAFYAILSDPLATAYWSTPPHTSLERSREWVQAMVDIPLGEGEDFAVEHEGRVIGKAGLYRFPEIGFIFHPTAWGQGFAAEALRPVLDRAFDVHGLEAVEADVDPRNLASLRLLSKLGFREVGRRKRTWLISGVWCDSVDLRLRRGEFRNQASG